MERYGTVQYHMILYSLLFCSALAKDIYHIIVSVANLSILSLILLFFDLKGGMQWAFIMVRLYVPFCVMFCY